MTEKRYSPTVEYMLDHEVTRDFGYTRRPDQEVGFVAVPVSMLEEALALHPDGDLGGLLATLVDKGRRGVFAGG
jgi:hypothetical protein